MAERGNKQQMGRLDAASGGRTSRRTTMVGRCQMLECMDGVGTRIHQAWLALAEAARTVAAGGAVHDGCGRRNRRLTRCGSSSYQNSPHRNSRADCQTMFAHALKCRHQGTGAMARSRTAKRSCFSGGQTNIMGPLAVRGRSRVAVGVDVGSSSPRSQHAARNRPLLGPPHVSLQASWNL